jgi:hypothetical protein
VLLLYSRDDTKILLSLDNSRQLANLFHCRDVRGATGATGAMKMNESTAPCQSLEKQKESARSLLESLLFSLQSEGALRIISHHSKESTAGGENTLDPLSAVMMVKVYDVLLERVVDGALRGAHLFRILFIWYRDVLGGNL